MSAASMATALRRCLLRRISLTGPGVPVPRATVQAARAPPISRRFMGTVSPHQGATMTRAELKEFIRTGTEAELKEFIRTGTEAELQEFINEMSKKNREKRAEFGRLLEKLPAEFKAIDVVLEERRKAVKNLEKLTNAVVGVIFATPVLLILASNYKA